MSMIGEMRGHKDRVLHMALSPDGETVVSAGADETLRFWKIFEAPVEEAKKNKAKIYLNDLRWESKKAKNKNLENFKE